MKEIKLEKNELEAIIYSLELAIKQNNAVKGSDKVVEKLKKQLNKKPITVSSRKAKGRNLQYKVCEMIAETIALSYDQHNEDCLIHSREMGQAGVDIILRGEARRRFPFSIECKAQENLSLPEWIKQAKTNNMKDTDWLVIFKKQAIGTEPVVCLDFQTFLNIYTDHFHKIVSES